jgi:hypothetical protein
MVSCLTRCGSPDALEGSRRTTHVGNRIRVSGKRAGGIGVLRIDVSASAKRFVLHPFFAPENEAHRFSQVVIGVHLAFRAAAENVAQAPATTEPPGPVAFALDTYHRRGVRERFWDSTPIMVPITSPETTSSTRRFCWRPSAVSFDATGCVFPNPFDVIDAAGTFSFAR